MADRTALLETLSELLIVVARIAFYTFIVVVAVLAVDVVALWLLNLPMDIDMWSALLLWECVILMAIGVGGWGVGEHSFGEVDRTQIGWKRPRPYHVILRPNYPEFWFSVAMAGFVLFILFVYLVSQYY